MTATELLNAHNEYADAYAAWETAHPFDLVTAMDRPSPPVQGIAAQAGEMIAERGSLVAAMAVALTDAMSRDIPESKRAVYTELVVAAVDGE
jgi:hypothetical protein